MAAKDVQVHSHPLPRLSTHLSAAIREDTLYTNDKGEEKSGIQKRNQKAIEQLQEALPKLLQSDEAVLYIARCDAPASFGEQFTLGWYIYMIIASVLVFTNKRVLHFRVKPKSFGGRDGWTWRRSLRAVAWGDLTEAKVSGWLGPSLTLQYRNGKREKFSRFRREDTKKIKLIVDAILPGAVAESTAAQGMVALCPRCWAVLAPDTFQCAQCRLLFKNKDTAVRRSLLIPGGGYFYTGHTFLGVMDAIAEGFLILLIVFVLLDISSGGPPGPDGDAAPWGTVIFLLVLLGIEKLFTIHHANRFIRDYIPAE
jgi:hypothetical protein